MQIYLVPLLYVTQKLALRRNIRIQHTLTAMDDKATAWLGLGAAIPVLWRYRDLCRSKDSTWRKEFKALGIILSIILYFLSSLLLTIVTPHLFPRVRYQRIVRALPAVSRDVSRYVVIQLIHKSTIYPT